jgi:ribosomal protein S18 acetylase RimI-like enzyme
MAPRQVDPRQRRYNSTAPQGTGRRRRAANQRNETMSDSATERMLDNPVWSCLSTHHAHFAQGGDLARRYLPEISPIAGLAGTSPEHVAALEGLFAVGDVLAVGGAAVPVLSPQWEVLRETRMLQMVLRRRVPAPRPVAEIAALSPADVDEVLALVDLAHPGPFRRRTMELGTYIGIRDRGRLVAMAGERMRVGNHREISAVCTHPEASGRGYARMLVSRIIDAMLRAELTPFLHVEADNERAIALYRTLGFVERAVFPLLYAKRIR